MKLQARVINCRVNKHLQKENFREDLVFKFSKWDVGHNDNDFTGFIARMNTVN